MEAVAAAVVVVEGGRRPMLAVQGVMETEEVLMDSQDITALLLQGAAEVMAALEAALMGGEMAPQVQVQVALMQAMAPRQQTAATPLTIVMVTQPLTSH